MAHREVGCRGELAAATSRHPRSSRIVGWRHGTARSAPHGTEVDSVRSEGSIACGRWRSLRWARCAHPNAALFLPACAKR
eukprot:353268-Chlamydomonas_euryale.AAC.14